MPIPQEPTSRRWNIPTPLPAAPPAADPYEDVADFEMSDEEDKRSGVHGQVLASSSLPVPETAAVSSVLASSSPTTVVDLTPPAAPSVTSPVTSPTTAPVASPTTVLATAAETHQSPTPMQDVQPSTSSSEEQRRSDASNRWAELSNQAFASTREYVRQRARISERDRHWSERDRDWEAPPRYSSRTSQESLSRRPASSRSPSPPTSSVPSSSESSSDNAVNRFRAPPSAPRAFYKSGQPSQRTPAFPRQNSRSGSSSAERLPPPTPRDKSASDKTAPAATKPPRPSPPTTAQGVLTTGITASLNEESLANSVFGYLWRDNQWGSELTIDEALCTLTYVVGTSTRGYSTMRIFIRQVGELREIWFECPHPHDVSVLSGSLDEHQDIHLVRVPFEEFQRHRNNSILQFNERVRHRVYNEESLVYMRDQQPSVDISPLRASQASLPHVGWYSYRIRRVDCSRGFFLIHLEENQKLTHGKRGGKKRKDNPVEAENEDSPQLLDRITTAPAPTLQLRLEGASSGSLESRLSSASRGSRGNRGQRRGSFRGRGRGQHPDKDDESAGPSLRDRLE
ncbi:hypothetical protein BDZ89DRAFT_1150094 [Hymenopellis radicata]|nr:hypothetical protein BDZ89DRAFT_1150094 [Hymenopellis radicata]